MSAVWPLSSWGLPLPSAEALQNSAHVLVADKTGRLIGEMRPDFDNVAWRLNKGSKIDMAISQNDPKATRDMLRFGNRMLISFNNGLPSWAGVFDPPRHWTPDGEIKFTVYSANHILSWRQTAAERVFDGVTMGYIMKSLIDDANALRRVGIEPGSVWMGGVSMPIELHFANLLETIEKELIGGELSTYDYDVTGSVEGGRLVLRANFYERKGRDLSRKVELINGHNIADVEVIEQGPILNAMSTAGRGSTWDDDRAVGYAEDAASIAEFDFRQGFAESEHVEQVVVDSLATNQIAEYGWPIARALVTAASLAPAEFAAYDVGDTVSVVIPGYMWGGLKVSMRIITREYFMSEGFCKLVPEGRM